MYHAHPAPLPLPAPPAGALVVNFDKDVLQLMREARYMQRLGLPIPDSARMVLLQEEKFTLYFNQLSHALRVCGARGWQRGSMCSWVGGPGKGSVRGQATTSTCPRPQCFHLLRSSPFRSWSG